MPLPARHALEIGCGGGDLAFGLMDAGTCERIDAFDVAETAIIGAQARAREQGMRTLRFHLLDGNTWVMPRNQYDFIYASHALHHIDNLEHLFAHAAAALQGGGVLFASDYVGPSRMQYSDAHLVAMNAALATLPDGKRRDRAGVLKTAIERRAIALYLQNDPSEAVRSAEIIPVLQQFFDVDVVPMGMSLSFEVLLEIIHNFDPDDASDNALIDGIIALEQQAERTGQAEPLFACLVARHKGAPRWEPPQPDFAAPLDSVPAPSVVLRSSAASRAGCRTRRPTSRPGCSTCSGRCGPRPACWSWECSRASTSACWPGWRRAPARRWWGSTPSPPASASRSRRPTGISRGTPPPLP